MTTAPIMSTLTSMSHSGSTHVSVTPTSVASMPVTLPSVSASPPAYVPSLLSATSVVAMPPVTVLPTTYTAPLLSQLPQIPRFSGDETNDGETFQDWLEHFELVATLGG